MVASGEQLHLHGLRPGLQGTGYGLQRGEKSVDVYNAHGSLTMDRQSGCSDDLFIIHCSLFIERSAPPPLSSASSVVKKSSSMNSGRGIWSTLIHREAAEVNGGPTRITDQQFGSSEDFFIERGDGATDCR